MDGLIALGVWLLYITVIFGSTVIVAVLVANYLNLSGILWWAVVIVSVLIINSLTS